ncbi:MAG: hypothetical protein HP490_16630 [Nitrospira sp.]|nr:hypothetical protein [Nitrospira sp.]
MSGQAFQRLRADLLQDARGEVLEIGFGTGLNLAHYPASVSGTFCPTEWRANRNRLMTQAGLRIARLDRFLLPDVPKITGVMYRGMATPFPAC